MIEKKVLSISLLCPGRDKDELVRCLESVMNIRRRIPSEIIIVDTGCDVDMKAVISRYADKVVEYNWSNDFAEARNAGLKECTGEWFMFIDDDEWFEDTDAVVDFFCSGEYRKYGRAEYIIRNLFDQSGESYSDFWTMRLIKRVDGLLFHGKIHEYLLPQEGECARLSCLSYHSGYIFKDKSEMFKKSWRNIPLLLEMTEDEPDNLQWRVQLIQEYNNIQDYSSLEKLCLKSLEEIKDNDSLSRARAMFYEGTLLAELGTYQFEKAISHVRLFLSDKRNSEKCNAGLYYYAVRAYWKKKDLKKIYEYSLKYLNIYDRIRQTEDTDIDDITFICGNIFEKERVQYCISKIVYAGVYSGDVSVLHEYFDRFDLSSHNDNIISFCEGVTYAFSQYETDQRFITYADKMCREKYLCTCLIDEAKKIENDSPEKFLRLIEVYGRISCANDIYLLYMHMLFAYEHDRRALPDLYRLLFKYVDCFFDVDQKIWQIAEKAGLDLLTMFMEIPFIKWKKCVDSVFDKQPEDKQYTIKMISEVLKDNLDIRSEYFRLKSEEQFLLKARNGQAVVLLNQYTSDCVTFYLKIYNAELFTGDITVLPMECQFAMRYISIVTSESEMTPLKQIEMLKECGNMFSKYNTTIQEYISDHFA
ncbi:MAG TPA: hypothetical protein DCQ87_04765 [Lachnospiraceae bacterium]|nr:hypothetical protein [Lachnospiraceae bacterium]